MSLAMAQPMGLAGCPATSVYGSQHPLQMAQARAVRGESHGWCCWCLDIHHNVIWISGVACGRAGREGKGREDEKLPRVRFFLGVFCGC